MSNYPDDIGQYTCRYCKEIIPNCTCEDEEEEESTEIDNEPD